MMSKLQIIQSKGQYINGEWIKGNGLILESTNPASGTLLWQGNNATDEEIANACYVAHRALKSWANTSFEERARYTIVFAEQVEKNRDQLARLISLETGKPLWESQTEVSSVIGKVNLSIQAYQERTWPKQTETAEANACLRFKPHGVVVVLGAFNFPAHLSNGHIVPALLAGNTVLYKPSEHTPAVAELIIQCWHDSGLPPGVINCLQGNANCGNTLLSQDIQGVYFTGSYATGLRIHQQFCNRPEVILALEMGGNNPLVIDEVKDIDAAVYHTILSTMITAGQRCTCARRIIIPDSQTGDLFLERFAKACKLMRIGSFDSQPEPFIGPVISHVQALKHLHAQKQLIEMGGEIILPMSLLLEYTGLVSPGIIDMTRAKNPPDEEIFAPFAQIYRYNHFDEAIQLANQTRYGLSAGLLSDNKDHYQQFYQNIRAGLINWNRPTTGAASSLPFGGVGCSGNHRPSAYFAADYCAYPVASMEQPLLTTPVQRLPGLVLE
ncbi:TPA: succinylglutamate-semialdehyde dehydrogenase [Legionella pneumophila subsp. pneumophila]|nr:succinylglutamate-semialdehyde dehydrogenase [Legionella pneumophila subsp. pneumophila]HAT9260809.1 succinylglutamate-semialdehyde dehydrogenase [Legionella pneumophila subsp. pneumophila]HAT9281363.1 succinylglutamate-semialdehyde dehydrogenase [Legionella pneumophila subsp. pneumophila]HAT9289444.1 succinylglutamate-semialdehyde dehydrogenase [Legionella pneumophila subsp. pneumophila]HAT9305229.1 succinylglutamate-semialdehyde dehydrogenase [Legionella pneumophila subsp. pneumophila]